MEFIAPIILYWENVLVAMDHLLPPTPSKLSEPIWHATWFSIAPTLHVDNVHLLEENITDYAYVGLASSNLLRPSVLAHTYKSTIMSYYI